MFKIDIETCPAGGGAMRIIACIEDSVVIEKILVHSSGEIRRSTAPNCAP